MAAQPAFPITSPSPCPQGAPFWPLLGWATCQGRLQGWGVGPQGLHHPRATGGPCAGAACKGTWLPEALPGGASGLRSESERWEGLQRSLGLGWGSWQQGPVVPPLGGALDGPWWPLPDPALGANSHRPGHTLALPLISPSPYPDTLSLSLFLPLCDLFLSPSDHMRWATLPGDPGPHPSQLCSGPPLPPVRPLLSPVFGAHRGQPEGHRASKGKVGIYHSLSTSRRTPSLAPPGTLLMSQGAISGSGKSQEDSAGLPSSASCSRREPPPPSPSK